MLIYHSNGYYDPLFKSRLKISHPDIEIILISNIYVALQLLGLLKNVFCYFLLNFIFFLEVAHLL
jgi:hypothetical protein